MISQTIRLEKFASFAALEAGEEVRCFLNVGFVVVALRSHQHYIPLVVVEEASPAASDVLIQSPMDKWFEVFGLRAIVRWLLPQQQGRK